MQEHHFNTKRCWHCFPRPCPRKKYQTVQVKEAPSFTSQPAGPSSETRLARIRQDKVTTLHLKSLVKVDATMSTTTTSPAPAIPYEYVPKSSIYIPESNPPIPRVSSSVWDSDPMMPLPQTSEVFLK